MTSVEPIALMALTPCSFDVALVATLFKIWTPFSCVGITGAVRLETVNSGMEEHPIHSPPSPFTLPLGQTATP
ncbi:hypothetical protein GCM10009093_09750 [Brevundimonas terrae]|uniref:Secreted protein n=1 Tax=Brevundimonas terrae TaxID=363631 RepID=A0ABN0Y7V2_9CAUL